jgi:hypothetical protein
MAREAKDDGFSVVRIWKDADWLAARDVFRDILWQLDLHHLKVRPSSERAFCSFDLHTYATQIGILAYEEEVRRDLEYVEACVDFLHEWFKRLRIPDLEIDPKFTRKSHRATTIIGHRIRDTAKTAKRDMA